MKHHLYRLLIALSAVLLLACSDNGSKKSSSSANSSSSVSEAKTEAPEEETAEETEETTEDTSEPTEETTSEEGTEEAEEIAEPEETEVESAEPEIVTPPVVGEINTLALSGADADAIGELAEFKYFTAQVTDFEDATYALLAQSIDILGALQGEVEFDESDLQNIDNLIISPSGAFINFNRDQTSYIYESECISGTSTACEEIIFDKEARTITLNNLTVVPSSEDSSEQENYATDTLIISGVFQWTAEDEDVSSIEELLD